MKENGAWTVSQKVKLRDGMTISRNAQMGSRNTVTWFSLGRGTSISQESYDRWSVYLGAEGEADFIIGQENPAGVQRLADGSLLLLAGGTLCGVECPQGAIYTEIVLEKEPVNMHEMVVPGRVLELRNLLDYEEGSIVNCDIVRNDSLRYVLMAFDAGTGLQPHRAPGNAIVTALEGSAVIGYEGENYTLHEGESFRFAKNALHSVTAAGGPFKMSLLLLLQQEDPA